MPGQFNGTKNMVFIHKQTIPGINSKISHMERYLLISRITKRILTIHT